MANPKEKTAMCLVNELARFNRVQPQYKLLNERGPAHSKMFSVQLSLGEQTWESEGSSIKKAQQAVANKALTESTLPKPVQKPPKSNVNNNPGSITPTVELNGLAMKRGEPAIYRPLDPKPFPNYRANYNFRGMYNQRYHCPVPKIFYVQLTVGNNEFFGEGKTRQAARHNAAMKALQALQNEPIPERSPQNGESGKDMDDDKDANKSEISLVFEIALKRNMPVSFEVIKESGPPHMKSFVTRVSVGEFSAEGEGNSKKLSKKRAATTVLQELKKLPPLPVVEKPKLFFKKRPKTIVKAGPEYGQGMNPISRLAQIQQAKKEKEPDYVLLSERGMPRRREFVMQVKVGNEVATGTGPNKKIAKKNAAEAMLLQLGYKASTNLQDQLEKTGENKGWSGPKPGFPEPTNNTPKGILHLSPDVYQEMEASRHKVISGTTLGYLSPKDMNQPSSSFFSISPTSNSSATIARELLMNGTSSTAEAIGLKGSSPTPPCSPVQPSKQLEYLARIQGFQVLGSHMGVGGASLQDEISRDCDLVLCLCLQSHLLPFTLYLTYTHALCSSSPELPHFMLLLSVPLRVCSLCLAHSLLAHRGILIVLLDSTKMSLQSIGLPKTKRKLNLCFLCAVSIHCTLSHCYAYQTVSQDLFILIYPTGQ
ncbi:PREDICTED: double-stranded RNA-binding protein Staufen homolog 2 isoform X4 [Cercocebus atys]|uniref:double-stranded RNA-binding protein Staufen homolog 2 isoform X4 n=1 Tax=Cercocebus atys TaxID=9531 RepID=UPI0005F4BF95|nr:PREDICTED: double-stranded RNA-binding protein Staufen homolog 2 isoform X4 [Cercocebus atys]